jgi:LAO/AO transport system kinase
LEDLIKGVRHRDRRSIARAITLIEGASDEAEALAEALYPHTGKAYVVGVTGPPGAGKSTLLNRLITHLRGEGLTVGVIAVDPTSPFSGGALLGDRVRMTEHALDEGVFIRSMGTRGHLGGLAAATQDAVRVLDAAGYDIILVETVGVGQTELTIMELADTVVLVLTPGAGDIVQVWKAGIMEIADLFLVNKADRDGARKLIADLEEMLDLAGKTAWRPPVIPTVATERRGIDELWRQLQRHRTHLRESGEGAARRLRHLRREVRGRMEHRLRQRLSELMLEPAFREDLDRLHRREEVPHRLVRKWLARLFAGEGGGSS